jgi:hypothetical protein
MLKASGFGQIRRPREPVDGEGVRFGVAPYAVRTATQTISPEV